VSQLLLLDATPQTDVHSLITLFLYMVAELSALQQIINALTGLNGLPALIVEAFVTTVYTSLGGFRVSFITDNIQGFMVVLLLIIGVITVGVETDIQHDLIAKSHYLDASLLGWQLIYILPVAILTNDFFIVSFPGYLTQHVCTIANPTNSPASGSAPSPPKPTKISISVSASPQSP
jgi:Na+/proline symporter